MCDCSDWGGLKDKCLINSSSSSQAGTQMTAEELYFIVSARGSGGQHQQQQQQAGRDWWACDHLRGAAFTSVCSRAVAVRGGGVTTWG
jgi:fermentation-respiration switch protein FrsA (DUF1100 family)